MRKRGGTSYSNRGNYIGHLVTSGHMPDSTHRDGRIDSLGVKACSDLMTASQNTGKRLYHYKITP